MSAVSMKLPPACDVGVEHLERALLVDRPAEHVAAEAQREDVELGVGEADDPLRVARAERLRYCTGYGGGRLSMMPLLTPETSM